MGTARKVLLVDDDEDLRGSLRDQLVMHEEFEVTEANTATRGIETAKSGSHERPSESDASNTESTRPAI